MIQDTKVCQQLATLQRGRLQRPMQHSTQWISKQRAVVSRDREGQWGRERERLDTNTAVISPLSSEPRGICLCSASFLDNYPQIASEAFH